MSTKSLPDRLIEIFRKRLPSWPYVMVAVGLWGFSQWLGEGEIVAPLRDTTAALLVDLKVISPVNVLGAYYYHLTGCSAGFVDGNIIANCHDAKSVWAQMELYGLQGISVLAWPFVVLLQTGITLWDGSGWTGRVIYLLTLPAGMYGAAETVYATGSTSRISDGSRVYDEWTFVGWSMFAVLVPAFAGLTALALQWLLILIVWIFGMALAGIVWVGAVLAGPVAYAQAVLDVVKEAKGIEEGHSVLKGKVGPPE